MPNAAAQEGVAGVCWCDGDQTVILGLGTLALLSLGMLRGLPIVGDLHRPAYAVLWTMGLSQDYHLFGWIDGINYHAQQTARLDPAGVEYPVSAILPSTMRHTLLQAYVNGIPWMLFPADRRDDFAARIVARLETSACSKEPWSGILEITTTISRITPVDPGLHHGGRTRSVRLECGVMTSRAAGVQ